LLISSQYALLLALSSLTASGLQATSGMLANESFSSSSAIVALNNSNGGSGWAGAWQTQNGSNAVPGYNIVSSSPLAPNGSAYGSYASGGSNWQSTGRALDVSSTGTFAGLLNPSGLIGTPGSAVYFSVIMRKDVNTDDEMSVTLHSGSGTPWWVSSPGIAVGHFGGDSNSGGVRYWSLKVAGAVYKTAAPVVIGQSAVLVCRIEFGSTNTVSLFVNPASTALPAVPDARVSTGSSIAFRSLAWNAGTAANQSSIDEIRIAGSYGGLAGIQTPVAPSNLSVVPGVGQIALSWNPAPQATAWQVYQVVNGTAQLLNVANTNTLVVAGLVPYATYAFNVVAVGPAGLSPPSATVTAVPFGAAPPPHPSLGTNLSQVTDYSRELPFVNVFKMARTWIPQFQGGSWGQGPPLPLDANGWIKSLQPGQYAETILLDNALDDQPNFPAGQYTVLYDGEGTIQFDLHSAVIVSQSPGRMVVTIAPGQNGVFLMETATNSANYLRNIRFIMPGFESTYLTQPFNPAFLQRLGSYHVLRFMEWMLTNGSAVRNWADRAAPGDYTYTWRGVPLEVLVQLANATGIAPWFNIPAQATDDYVRQFSTTLNQQLNRSLRFYLEYSNETWNGTFSQTPWIQSQGQSAGLSTDPTLAGFYFNAVRSSQIFAIFRSSVVSSAAAPDRMVRVMAAQAANSWLSDQMLGFRNAFASADVLAIAPYFNCDDTGAGGFGILGDPATAARVDAMSVDQVVDIELAHINGCANQQMQSSAAVARKYGLRLVAYEGGQSLAGYYGAENDSVMTALFKAANRSGRMNALYAQYLADWVAAGGDLFAHYSDVTAYTKYGNWGALEYQDQDPNTAPKYQALMTFGSQHP
jgi:hypothetical protein